MKENKQKLNQNIQNLKENLFNLKGIILYKISMKKSRIKTSNVYKVKIINNYLQTINKKTKPQIQIKLVFMPI